ncbi:MAG: ABC transporter ATP-binding protein [Geminicoccaceae bacterium]
MSEQQHPDSEVIIEVRGLVAAFDDHVVLDGVDLDICRGEVIGIVGGSGSGKSVLLKSILGLLRPRAGSVRILGHDLWQLSRDERRQVQRRWGVLFQDDALFSSLTILDNVQRVLLEHISLSRALSRRIAALKVSMVGLDPEICQHYPSELSGGMRKKAGLARALALGPEILFLDEPTAGLDPISSREFAELIRELHETLGLTVVLVTHDLDTLHAVCEWMAVVADRRIVASGRYEDVRENDHPWIRAFFERRRTRAAAAE